MRRLLNTEAAASDDVPTAEPEGNPEPEGRPESGEWDGAPEPEPEGTAQWAGTVIGAAVVAIIVVVAIVSWWRHYFDTTILPSLKIAIVMYCL